MELVLVLAIISIFAVGGIGFAIRMNGMSNASVRASQFYTTKKMAEDFVRNSTTDDDALETEINARLHDSGLIDFSVEIGAPEQVKSGLEKFTVRIIDGRLNREESIYVYKNE